MGLSAVADYLREHEAGGTASNVGAGGSQRGRCVRTTSCQLPSATAKASVCCASVPSLRRRFVASVVRTYAFTDLQLELGWS